MPVQKKSEQEALKKIKFMLEASDKMLAIAEQRMAFNKHYRDYVMSCTVEEYQSFLADFLPKIEIEKDILVTPAFPQFSTKSDAAQFFQYTMGEYTKLVVMIRKIKSSLTQVEDDANLDDIKRAIDKGAYVEKDWLVGYGMLFENFKESFKAFLKQRKKPYNSKVASLVEQFKEYAMPELTFIQEITELLDSISTPVIRNTMETMAEIKDELRKPSTPANQIENINKIVTQLQKRISKEVKVNKNSLAKLIAEDTGAQFITEVRGEEITSDLDGAKAMAMQTIEPTLNLATLYDIVYESYWILDYCRVLQSELQEKSALLKNEQKKEQKPSKSFLGSTASSAGLESAATVASVAVNLEQMRLDAEMAAKLQAEEDERERQILANIEAQNALAREEGKKQQAEKQLLFSQKKEAVYDNEEEEETLGSTLATAKIILNSKNYATLVSIFAEEHNAITYSQAVNLIECEAIGGKVTSRKGGGSNRKITIGRFDTDTFEPTDDTEVGGFHSKHKPGHNDKKLIKPIIQDIKKVFEKAGITPANCATKNAASVSNPPRLND